MIITVEGIRKRCVVVKKIKNKRFYIKIDDQYLTVFENNNKRVRLVLEVSLNENDTCISPCNLWGIIGKSTYGEEIYIKEKELIKLQKSKKLIPKTMKKKKDKEIDNYNNIVELEWEKRNLMCQENITKKEG